MIKNCKYIQVIALYPNSPFKIGDIIKLDKIDFDIFYHEYTKSEPYHIEENDVIKYPKIFKLINI